MLPLHLGREDVARKYAALLANLPNLMIVDIDRNVARQGARLRAGYNICIADSLQVAACLVQSAEVLITNDRRPDRLKHLIDVAVLDDMKTGK